MFRTYLWLFAIKTHSFMVFSIEYFYLVLYRTFINPIKIRIIILRCCYYVIRTIISLLYWIFIGECTCLEHICLHSACIFTRIFPAITHWISILYNKLWRLNTTSVITLHILWYILILIISLLLSSRM